MIRMALAGNPNSGKTTLFNSLTGSTAHVGNWPGVTVDKREGVYKKEGKNISIVDLPGIYSLSPYTPEERISRNYLLEELPDCIINIVDATNLERNLYLTTQLLELDIPVVVALNMIDEVEKRNDVIKENLLEKALGVPVVKISALKNKGLTELMNKAIEASNKPRKGCNVIKHHEVGSLINEIKESLENKKIASAVFHAVKIVENDEAETYLKDYTEKVNSFKENFTDKVFEDDLESLIADERYQYISSIVSESYYHKEKDVFKLSASDKADKVLTHRIWGIPIFLVILFAIFHLTFSEDLFYLSAIFDLPDLESLNLIVDGEPINYGVRILQTFYDGAVASPGVFINNVWNDLIVGDLFGLVQGVVEESAMAPWAIGLINNGIIDGLAAVLSFLPPILVLFLFFSILEDSGYMARIAFILDRIFRRFGLSGRAFMPMIMGFGCSVPAMINTRTLADDLEKTATVRVIPFFSCGAKLPILTAVAGGIVCYFGIGNAELITYAMYLLGITAAVICVLLMRNTSLKGETPPFIMELPQYHRPQFKNLMLHLWDKTKHFIKKAFTIILASTIIIWVLTHFSFDWHLLEDEQVNESILAGLSKLVQPIFTPLGFGSQLGMFGWVFVVAVITGLIAKENVITTFATLACCLMAVTSMDFAGLDILDESGIDAVQAMIQATNITIPGLISFIAFNMTTIPCFAAVATAKAELSPKRFKTTLLFWLVSSYLVGVIIFTVLTWWWTIFIWLVVALALTLLVIFYNKNKLKGTKKWILKK